MQFRYVHLRIESSRMYSSYVQIIEYNLSVSNTMFCNI
jgi:hypothetical protein